MRLVKTALASRDRMRTGDLEQVSAPGTGDMTHTRPSSAFPLILLRRRASPRACASPRHSGLDTLMLARLSSIVSLLVGAALVASPAAAAITLQADPDPITGQIGIASQYTGKGLGKSDEDPAAFGSVRWQTNGFYANAFVSEATSSRGADAEVILSAGYERELGDWDVDVVVMHRQMIGETIGVDSSYVEFQGDVSRALTDSISVRFRVNYSADGYGATEAAWWAEAQATVKLTSNDKLSAAYGQRRLDGGNDYDAWNVGVKHKFTPAISGDLRWYDTDRHDLGGRYDGRLVAALTFSF